MRLADSRHTSEPKSMSLFGSLRTDEIAVGIDCTVIGVFGGNEQLAVADKTAQIDAAQFGGRELGGGGDGIFQSIGIKRAQLGVGNGDFGRQLGVDTERDAFLRRLGLE